MDTQSPQAGQQVADPKKLFIGNVPFNTTEDELRDLFAQYGTVISAKLITDRMTGRSKGIAFVEMSTEEEAQNAINGANNAEFGGRPLVVNVARPQVPRERRSFGGGNGGGGGYRSGGSSFGDRRGGGGGNRRSSGGGGGYRSSGGYNDSGYDRD